MTNDVKPVFIYLLGIWMLFLVKWLSNLLGIFSVGLLVFFLLICKVSSCSLCFCLSFCLSALESLGRNKLSILPK